MKLGRAKSKENLHVDPERVTDDGWRKRMAMREVGSRVLKLVMLVILLAVGAWALYANLRPDRPAMDMNMRITSGTTPFPVVVSTVERGSITGTVVYTGSVAPFNEEDIYPRVTGRIVEMLVYPGDAVRPGQVLARLDSVELSSRVREAEAALAAARATRVQVEKELAMTAAEAGYARGVAARTERLFNTGAVSKQEHESDQALAATAEAKLEAARAKLHAAEAMLAQGEAASRTATIVRNYSDIVSSTSGYVVKRLVAPGVLVQPGTVVLKVAQIDKVRLQANVGEKDLGSIRVGSPVQVTTTAAGQPALAATVTAVFPFVEQGPRTAVIEALVDNAGRRLLPGQYVTMQFVTGQRDQALIVPASAVIRMGGKATLWVVKDGLAEPRPVVTGLHNAERVEIAEGLTGSERLIARGQEGLYAGAKVNDVSGASPPSSPPTGPQQEMPAKPGMKDMPGMKESTDTPIKPKERSMWIIELRYVRQVARFATLAVSLVLVLAESVGAQPLPRVEGPLTMDQAVELAREKSLRVKASDADARTMDSMRREALAPFWPQASANGYFNDQRQAPNVYTSAGNTMARNYQVFNADQNRDANLTLMYPIFSGGRDYYGYKAAAARADAARHMLKGTELDVVMQARLDYIAVLRESENARVTGELLRDVEERLRVSREMLDAGRAPRYYVLRDETELANVIQMDAMARSRVELALVSLKTTMGVDLASPITLADRLEFTGVTLSIDEGIRQASEAHPDLKAAAKQREAAAAEVRAAYGNYFPQVSIGYMYDWAWMKNRTWDSQAEGLRSRGDSSDGYSVGVVVTLPIFDGFARENALKTAKAKLEKAIQSEGLVRQQIAKEVNQAALMLVAAEKSVKASRKGVEQSVEESRIVKERFGAGRGIQIEILDAQVSLTRARFNAVAALADYNSALAMWLKATGRVR